MSGRPRQDTWVDVHHDSYRKNLDGPIKNIPLPPITGNGVVCDLHLCLRVWGRATPEVDGSAGVGCVDRSCPENATISFSGFGTDHGFRCSEVSHTSHCRQCRRPPSVTWSCAPTFGRPVPSPGHAPESASTGKVHFGSARTSSRYYRCDWRTRWPCSDSRSWSWTRVSVRPPRSRVPSPAGPGVSRTSETSSGSVVVPPRS